MLTKVLRDTFGALTRGRTPAKDGTAALKTAVDHLAAGDLDAAISACRRALDSGAELGPIHHVLGCAFAQQERFAEARAAFERALFLTPEDATVLVDFGNMHALAGHDDEALQCYRKALAIQPEDETARLSCARALKRTGRSDAAIELLRSVRSASISPQTLRMLVGLLDGEGLIDEAKATCAIVLDEHPDDIHANALFGYLVLRHDRDAPRATAHFERAVSGLADDPDLWSNYGIALQVQGELTGAAHCYERALAIAPNHAATQVHRALLLLLRGDVNAGWDAYEHRRRAPDWVDPPYELPLWQGEDLQGKVLFVHSEQGIGDEILFAACLPLLKARVGHLAIECNAKLAPLFARSFADATIVSVDARRTPSPRAPCNASAMVAMGSLPRLLGFRRESRGVSYLIADETAIAAARSRLLALGPGLKVGVSWRGGTPKTWGDVRSIPLSRFDELFAVPGVQFVSLQYGDATKDIVAAGANGALLHSFSDTLTDLDQTAALICALDLVVSVDTTIVHLADALGREVWAMVPIAPDWRYGAEGDMTNWYAGVRPYRQSRYQHWDDVLSRVASDLHARSRGILERSC